MLVVTTTVRMVNRVHSNTTSTGPVVALGLVLVVRTAGLQEGLVNPSTTRNDTDGRTCAAADGLLCTRGETNASLVVLSRVADNSRVVPARPCKRTAVADLLLDVAHNRTFRELPDGKDVSDGEGGLLAAVDECTGVEALGRDEGLFTKLVAVGVAEDDAGEGRATARVVDDLLHYAADVAIALSEVEVA